jgi:hypothetical protein
MPIDISKAFTFPFRDPQWARKAGIAAGVFVAAAALSALVTGVLGFLLGLVTAGLGAILVLPLGALLSFVITAPALGWQLETLRQVSREGNEALLPDWTDWKSYLARGVILGLLNFAYYVLPVGLVVLGTAGTFGSFFLALVAAGDRSNPLPGVIGGGVGLVLLLLGGLLLLGVSVLWPMVLLRYALTGRAGEAFNLGGILAGIRKGLGAYLLILLLVLVVGLGLGSVLGAISAPLSGLFSLIPVVGLVLGPTLNALVMAPLFVFMLIFLANLLGQYQRAFGAVEVDSAPEPAAMSSDFSG